MESERNVTAYESLGISNDFMFGRIMSDEKICKPFLETLLSIKIDHIKYLDEQKVVNPKVDAHSVRFDIYVDDGRTVYNCEMQTTANRNLPKRSRYYQGMIDINLLSKSMNYSKLKKSFVIFICTFDPFNKDAYVYTFRNTCKEYPEMELEDDTYKIFFNTKGKKGNISPGLKEVLEFIQTSEVPERCTDPLIREMNLALQKARNNEEWRNDYMTLELMKQEKFEEGKQEGKQEAAVLFTKVLTEAEKKKIKIDYSRLQDMEYIDDLCKTLKISM